MGTVIGTQKMDGMKYVFVFGALLGFDNGDLFTCHIYLELSNLLPKFFVTSPETVTRRRVNNIGFIYFPLSNVITSISFSIR